MPVSELVSVQATVLEQVLEQVQASEPELAQVQVRVRVPEPVRG